MLVFELSGPNLVYIPNSAQYRSQILRGAFGKFVAMAPAQNVTNWFDLQNVS